MIIPLILAALQIGNVAPDRSVIVFGKGDSILVQPSTPIPEAPTKDIFFRAFKADLDHPAEFGPQIDLTNLPSGGRLVPGASGESSFTVRSAADSSCGSPLKDFFPIIRTS